MRQKLLSIALVAIVGFVPSLQAQSQLGFDTTNLDTSVRPQDDFYKYVNGGWLKRNQIPADASSWSSFGQVRDDARSALRTVIEQAVRTPRSVDARKLANIYESYLDSARVEKLGLTPLRIELQRISAIRTKADLPAAFAWHRRFTTPAPYFGAPAFATPPFVLAVTTDPKASDANTVIIGQGGLGLPDRDYYSGTSAQMDSARTGYVAYVTTLLKAAGQPDAAGAANRIYQLEAALAARQWDRAKERDRDATYNKMTVAQLAALTPAFDWRAHLRAAGVGSAKEVIVREPDYIKAFGDIVAATPISTWREYFTFKLLDTYSYDLPTPFQTARFEFRDKLLSGRSAIAPRWKRAVDRVEWSMGEAAGKLYVDKYFPPASKARMTQLVSNILAAYRVGIDSLAWMQPATKAAAQEKLSKIGVKIGYPDKWRDFSSLEIRKGDLFGNSIRASRYYYDDMIRQLGKPADRNRWTMTPQTVNAQYSSTKNDILFPAGILQPPFFNPAADDAVNYGAIGAVIGHEISHGFDDQGRKSDGNGNLRNWWTDADAAAFTSRATALGAQYAVIVPVDDIHINPKLTMGENIGDLSGIAAAYRAYKISLGGKPAPVIAGFTGDQRFFIGYAQIWRTLARDASVRQNLLTDSHSPGPYRVSVPLVNIDAFQAAFNIQPGDRMYRAPADRVKIW